MFEDEGAAGEWREVELTRQIEHLERGLVTRTVIGQAQGILMERHRITAEAAFERLCTISMGCNRKLHQVALDLVETRAEVAPPKEHASRASQPPDDR